MITNNYITSPNFKAKFFYSKPLDDVVSYAIKKDEYSKLSTARHNINNTCLKTRLLFDFGINKNGLPFVSFTRFEPKHHIIIPQTIEDYMEHKPVVYICQNRKTSLMEFALHKLIKLGNNAPNNKMYKAVVMGR